METTPPFPAPPPALFERPSPAFAVAAGLDAWVREVLLEEESGLYNEDHAHLVSAEIGYLWATGGARSKGRAVIGQAEIFQPKGVGFVKTRQLAQVEDLFGHSTHDFLVTLDAEYVAEALAAGDATSVMALLEHELYHCAQAIDEFGAPRYTRKGRPVYALRGHDVEEHLGVVRRYGAHSPELQELTRLASRGPEVGRAGLAGVCGTCLRRVG